MMKFTSDTDFIEGFKRNDDRAITAFYDKHHRLFWGTLGKNFSRLPEDDLETSFNDSILFVKDAVVRGKFTGGNLKAYFMRTAQLKVYEAARKAGYRFDKTKSQEENDDEVRRACTIIEPRTKTMYSLDDDETMNIEDTSPAAIRRKELYQALDDLVKDLPEKCRQLFHLHLNIGKSMKEIFPILGYENERVAISKNKKCKDKLVNLANATNLASYL